MGGGIGPPIGVLMRGTPEKGGGPFGAILTATGCSAKDVMLGTEGTSGSCRTVCLPSSITLLGEEPLELLFIMAAVPDPGSEGEGFPDASADHRG